MRGFEIGRRLRGTVDTVTVSTPWSPRSGRKQDAFGQLPVDGAQGFLGAPAGGRPGVAPPPNKTGARQVPSYHGALQAGQKQGSVPPGPSVPSGST